MQYFYNFLWFLAGLGLIIFGAVLVIPTLLILTIAKIFTIIVVVALFSGLLIFTKLFGGDPIRMHFVRETGKQCIFKI